MRRHHLEHAIRTACQIIGHAEVIIVGSQSILGTYDEADGEGDMAPIAREQFYAVLAGANSQNLGPAKANGPPGIDYPHNLGPDTDARNSSGDGKQTARADQDRQPS